eukprot:661358-Amphidinium_carterae.1
MDADIEADIPEEVERAPVGARRAPEAPSLAEREQHEAAGHVPYRDWCPACIAGRGRADNHRKREPGEVAQVAVDYCYLSGRADATEAEAELEGCSPILVLRDKWTSLVFAEVLQSKIVCSLKGVEVIPEESAPGDHAGNGLAEVG